MINWMMYGCAIAFWMMGGMFRMYTDDKISVHGHLVDAVGSLIGVVWSALTHDYSVYTFSAITAHDLWRWWNRGGGDGIKKWVKSRSQAPKAVHQGA